MPISICESALLLLSSILLAEHSRVRKTSNRKQSPSRVTLLRDMKLVPKQTRKYKTEEASPALLSKPRTQGLYVCVCWGDGEQCRTGRSVYWDKEQESIWLIGLRVSLQQRWHDCHSLIYSCTFTDSLIPQVLLEHRMCIRFSARGYCSIQSRCDNRDFSGGPKVKISLFNEGFDLWVGSWGLTCLVAKKPKKKKKMQYCNKFNKNQKKKKRKMMWYLTCGGHSRVEVIITRW